MPTLQEDIDALDRMIENGAPKDAIRSQIRLIAREVSALETDYARLTTDHQQLAAQHAALQAAQRAPSPDVPETEQERVLKSIGAWAG